MPTNDLAKAYAALSGKQARYDMLFKYFDGEHPVVYTAKRLEAIFSDIDARFQQNWCEVVITAVTDRIALQGFTAKDGAAQKKLDALWGELGIALEADEAHTPALVCGEAFLIAWRDEEQGTHVYANDPRLCHVFYEPANPRKKQFAAKWWVDDDGKRRITLYYPDRLEYYISRGKAPNVSSAKSFMELQEPETHEYGAVPVFHLRPERRVVKSDLQNVISPQNAINKLLIDMMVAAEYGAFKQKYVISHMDEGEAQKLKNAPSEVWDLPGGGPNEQPTQVGEFSATDLDNYLRAIDKLATALGSITRTPKHYFFAQGGDPSGEALIAMESPLNKKAQDRIDRFVPEMQALAAFLLVLEGINVAPSSITPRYARPETVQPLTGAQIVQAETSSGVPLTTSLRRNGWTDAELTQMQKDRAAEMAAGPNTPQPREAAEDTNGREA